MVSTVTSQYEGSVNWLALWSLSRYFDFFQQSKVMLVRRISDSKLAIDLKMSVNVFLSICDLWRPYFAFFPVTIGIGISVLEDLRPEIIDDIVSCCWCHSNRRQCENAPKLFYNFLMSTRFLVNYFGLILNWRYMLDKMLYFHILNTKLHNS